MKITPKIETYISYLIWAGFLAPWVPFTASFFGLELLTQISTAIALFIGGSALSAGAYLFINKKYDRSKTDRIFQWLFILAGFALISLGFKTLNLSPYANLIFSIPVLKLLSGRSFRDIINDTAKVKHPWMDILSDLSFLLSMVLLVLMFFGFFSEALLSATFLSIAFSVYIDQIHQGINKKSWAKPIGLMIASGILFLIPGLVVLSWV